MASAINSFSHAFQFTRPRGARHPQVRQPARRQRFNSRAHGGRDNSGFGSTGGLKGFNSRAHGGRDRLRMLIRGPPSCFNSRAHGGRDENDRPPARRLAVSIHAPSGGATAARALDRVLAHVSIHAPTGGATGDGPGSCGCNQFQFTRPRGARLVSVGLQVSSIGFNSRAHGGRDVRLHARPGRPVCFNSRAHGGRDRRCRAGAFCAGRFNSRAHGGRDGEVRADAGRARVSIHAPTGGATPPQKAAAPPRWFQFTRPRGARPRGDTGQIIMFVSIHAPTGGATGVSESTTRFAAVSIHAPTGGATVLDERGVIGCGVSIHAPTGGATSP